MFSKELGFGFHKNGEEWHLPVFVDGNEVLMARSDDFSRLTTVMEILKYLAHDIDDTAVST